MRGRRGGLFFHVNCHAVRREQIHLLADLLDASFQRISRAVQEVRDALRHIGRRLFQIDNLLLAFFQAVGGAAGIIEAMNGAAHADAHLARLLDTAEA